MDDFLGDDLIVEMGLSFGTHGNGTFLEGKKSMITAHSDIATRKNFRAALAHQNGAHECFRSGSYFDAEILWIRISAVFC